MQLCDYCPCSYCNDHKMTFNDVDGRQQCPHHEENGAPVEQVHQAKQEEKPQENGNTQSDESDRKVENGDSGVEGDSKGEDNMDAGVGDDGGDEKVEKNDETDATYTSDAKNNVDHVNGTNGTNGLVDAADGDDEIIVGNGVAVDREDGLNNVGEHVA